MARLTWPDYVPATPSGPGGRASRSAINRASSNHTERTMAFAAAGSLAPVVYGIDQVGPYWFKAGRLGRNLVIAAYWCVGEIGGVEAVTQRNGDPLPDGVQMTHYRGTLDQAVDPWLAAAIDGYADTLVDTWDGIPCALAYTVFLVPPGAEAALDCVATIRGRLVYDPRTDTTAWSPNPSLCMADFMASPLYGAGWAVDWPSIGVAADANDEILADGNPRRELNLTIKDQASIEDHLEALRTYAGAFIVRDGHQRALVPDRPAPVARAIDGDQLLDLKLRRRRAANAPTVVRVRYTDRTETPWKDAHAEAVLPEVEAGTLERRVSTVKLPGYNTHAQAYREAVERLNAATLLDLEGSARATDESLQDRRGDIVTITDELGLDAKAFRLTAVRPVAMGEWALEFAEYAESVYSDSVATGPGPGDTHLPHPSEVPGVDDLTATEEIYQLQNGDYASRLRATWAAADYPYRHHYEWQILDGDTLIWRDASPGTELTTPAVAELVTYTVRVRVVSELGYQSETWTETTLTAQGKYLAPGNVPQITARQVAADAIKVEWQEAADIDIYRYELRRGAPGVTWESAAVVDRIDGLQARIEGLALGDHDLLIRALDSVRQYSPDVTRTTVTVAPPTAPASLQGFEVGGQVRLSWPPGAGFVAAYELRYGAIHGDWASAHRLDRLTALRLVTDEVPAGWWRFYVRAIDAAGTFSDDQASLDIEVTLDSAAFLVDQHAYDAAQTTSMTSWRNRAAGGQRTYVTATAETPATLWPNAMATYTEPLATYHAPTTSEWVSDVWDLGYDLSGTWRATVDYGAIDGSATATLELSLDGQTWESVGGLVTKRRARYARIRITGDGTLFVRVPTVSARIDVVPRTETGRAMSSANGPTTIHLTGLYAAVRSITVTPEGAEPLNSVVDNIGLHGDLYLSRESGGFVLTEAGDRIQLDGAQYSFDVYLFDKDGNQVARPFMWEFKGV
ncbi:hypothetical protein [Arhodomonas sp. AD133]|uniref:hypothetical protein n=1 Tax=Arhodomonas sp. AD133 TaxID=3415009 RepID=UPI003EC0445B